MGEHVVGQSKAWEVYDKLTSDPRVNFLPEPEGVERHLRRFTRGRQPSANAWSDAYLAAAAAASGFTLVTMDRAFASLPTIDALIL